MSGDLKEVMRDLGEAFQQIMGSVALNLVARELKENDVDKEKLPEELKERY